MGNVLTIFRREFAAYFNSPIAYIFMVLFVSLSAILFFFIGHFYLSDSADMRSYFTFLLFVYALFVPGLAMRLWSEERKLGTEELLLTLPIRTHEIVLGKFLAGYALLGIALLFTGFIPITVARLGDPDWGPILVGYLGAFLVGGVFLSIGSFFSALTENQILAMGVSLLVCAVLIFLGYIGFVAELKATFGGLAPLLTFFGVTSHFENAQKGLLDLRDFIYYLSVMALFLFLNHFAVENRKY